MLPPPALKILVKFLRFCSLLRLFPYGFKFDKGSVEIKVQRTKERRLIYWTMELGMCAYQVFLLWRAKQILDMHFLHISVRVKALYMILSFVGMSYNRLVVIRHHSELPLLLKSFVSLPTKFAASHQIQSDGVQKDCVSNSLRIIIIPTFILLALNILVAVKKPQAPHLLSSLWQNPSAIPKPLRAGLVIVQAYINCSQYLTAAFNLTVVICHVDSILPMIHSMRLPIRGKPLSDRTRRSSCRLTDEQRVRYYYQLRTLQALFNAVYSKWSLGAQTYFMIGMVVNNFQAVVFFSMRGLLASLVLSSLCVMIFKHLGHVWEASSRMLESWKAGDRVPARVFDKWHRSFRPLRVKVSSLYYADYMLVIVILSVVLSNSGTLILAYKDSLNRSTVQY